MVITAVDTTILLDVLVNDPKHVERSESLLLKAYKQGSLIIALAVYAELMPYARNRKELDGWLQQMAIDVILLNKEHAYTAGMGHVGYRKAGGKRERILADFLMGAHAIHEADRILTRDRGFYRKYFSGLQILSE